jgi:hypothetical protein
MRLVQGLGVFFSSRQSHRRREPIRVLTIDSGAVILPTLKHPSAALPDPPPRPVAGVFSSNRTKKPMTRRLEWVILDARRT